MVIEPRLSTLSKKKKSHLLSFVSFLYYFTISETRASADLVVPPLAPASLGTEWVGEKKGFLELLQVEHDEQLLRCCNPSLLLSPVRRVLDTTSIDPSDAFEIQELQFSPTILSSPPTALYFDVIHSPYAFHNPVCIEIAHDTTHSLVDPHSGKRPFHCVGPEYFGDLSIWPFFELE